MSDYRRNNSSYTREDPRLRHSAKSPQKESRKASPNRDPRTRTSSDSWEQQSTQFGQSSMQTTYQHLQPPTPVVQQVQYTPNQYEQQNYYPNYNQYGYSQYQYHTTQANQLYNVQSGAVLQEPPEVQPGPPVSTEYPQRGWDPVSSYNQQQSVPPADYNQQSVDNNDSNKSDGVVEELSKHKAGLLKERDTYQERINALKSKLTMLVEQKDQLSSKRSPDRETMHIIKENTKLQVEIQSKIKDAKNVIEILTGIIGDNKEDEEEEEEIKAKPQGDDSKAEVNYKHYDPEIHWCRMCDVFPQSAKELLVHLHSKEHQDTSQEEVPWHKVPPEPKFPVFEGAPTRRLPIKGLQFFVASTAWYCRLCDAWIGDLHCASQHLMSLTHSQNYSNFVEQNPHWEIEWLKDREKAVERIKRNKGESDGDDKKKKKQRKEKYSPTSGAQIKEKKKKKRSKKRKKHSSDSSSSSSSSSSSEDDKKGDKSKSIRVAMRNKMKLLGEGDDKWDLIGKLVEEERKRQEILKMVAKKSPDIKPASDALMSQWMTVSEPPVKDKQLLDGLKEKLKQKQDAEKAKLSAEYEVARREREREEENDRNQEKMEQQARSKEREEDSYRQKRMGAAAVKGLKFKPKENYRRHNKSTSPSPERRRRRSRSVTPEQTRRNIRNGRRSFDRSPHMRYNNKDKHDDEPKREKKPPPPPPSYKKLPFIGRMPLFKNTKSKKNDEDKKEKEVIREDYDIPRRSRFQPGNLVRTFIPDPDVVCFPRLSSYPPIAPPPPELIPTKAPEPPTISVPKAPPPPKLKDKVKDIPVAAATAAQMQPDDYSMLYEDSSNAMMYNYGNMDYNMMYQPPPQSFNFTQDVGEHEDVPRSHTMPLEPPPLPPDDPNDDLAMLGISTDDMAVQMF